MKKLVLLLLLTIVSVSVFGQLKIRDEYWGNGIPTATPSYSNAMHIDTTNKKVYRFKKSEGWLDETYRFAGFYFKEDYLAVGEGDAERTSGGYKAVVIRDHYVFCHPRGNGDIKPESGGRTYDEVNLQKAINYAQSQGRVLYTLGKTYYITEALKIDKYEKFFTWRGFRTRLVDINGGTNPFIGSDMPTDMDDAHKMVERKPIISGLTFASSVDGTQNGIDVGPTYGADFQFINGEKLNWVIYLRFGLETTINKTYATFCENGWYVGIGDWPGSTIHNSQSNISTVTNARWYGDSEGIALHVHQSYGVRTDNIYAEGFRIGTAFFLDAEQSTTVKNHTFERCGLETVNGVGTAAFKIRMAGGIVRIVDPASGYPALMVDAKSEPGYTQVNVERSMWWAPLNGKIFNNLGNISWKIIDCDNQLYGTDLTGLFAGSPVYMNCGPAAGYNSVCVEPINR